MKTDASVRTDAAFVRAQKAINFYMKWRPTIQFAAMFLAMFIFPQVAAFAQSSAPNPFGGSGTSKLSNAGSNVLVLLTWAAFLIGIIAFITVPFAIWMEKPYMKNLAVGIIGIGGFAIIGSIAYDIVNISGMSMNDPALGK